MSSQDNYEDAEIDGLSERSWFGSCLRGVLVGAVLFVVGVIALSLSHPLPEHLPGVGKVEIVRNDVGTAPQPTTAPEEQPTRAPDDQPTAAPTEQPAVETNQQDDAPASDSENTEQPAETEPTEPEVAVTQPAPDADDAESGQSPVSAPNEQTPATAAAPAQPESPAQPQSEETTAPAAPEQQAAAQPTQPALETDGGLTDDGGGDTAPAQPAPNQNDEDVAQPQDTQAPAQPDGSATATDGSTESTDQQVAAINPEQPQQPVPEINLPGPALSVNARPFDSPEGAALLAVVLRGADGNAISTEALPLMTMPLTMAVPSGAGNRNFAEQARAAGHEVLVQLPMATEDAAQNGGWTTDQAAASLSAEAARHMAELDMAIGATAPHEAPLLRDQDGMTAVMDPLAPHGFIWIDPRLGIGSAAKGVAALQDMSWSAGDRFIDGPADEDRIYQNLESAAAVARRNGSSIVFIDASPDALKALVRWGLNRGGKAVWFAPVSAVVKMRQAK